MSDYTPRSSIPGVPLSIPEELNDEFSMALGIRVRMAEIMSRLDAGGPELERAVVFRPPSPEPEYDMDGIRVNTRTARARQRLQEEFEELCQVARALVPAFEVPQPQMHPGGHGGGGRGRGTAPGRGGRADFGGPVQRKLRVPVDEYPGYNFIGQILGPRGDTHKKMETQSGCKIALRGRGSTKDARSAHDSEPLHVIISGPNEAAVAKAASMVEGILVPVDDMQNERKQLQLRKLAEYNGTMRDHTRALMRERQERELRGERRIACAICGDGSHPTTDCPFRDSSNASKLDSDVDRFMAELEGGGGGDVDDTNNVINSIPPDELKILEEDVDKFLESL